MRSNTALDRRLAGNTMHDFKYYYCNVISDGELIVSDIENVWPYLMDIGNITRC